MATVHGEVPEKLPGRVGEYLTAKWLSELDDQDLHLWFGINYLQNVGDIDILLAHPSTGFMVIEVKGHPLQLIETYRRQGIRFQGSGTRETLHPALQAHKNSQRLKSWFSQQAHGKQGHWISAGAWWPNIFRADWLEVFQESPEALSDAELMLFTDEMDDPRLFFECLQKVRLSPLFGNPIPAGALKNQGGLDDYIRLLDSQSEPVRPRELPSKTTNMIPQSVIKAAQTATSSPAPSKRVAYYGAPGSGKTEKLLELGLEALTRGERVLFVCFNKTLAAEVRRSVNIRAGQLQRGEFIALNIHQLPRYLLPESAPHLKSLELQLRNHENLESFDVILIDESQDFPEEGIPPLKRLAHPETQVAISWGEGQALRPPFKIPPELVQWMGDVKPNTLARNFRNGAQAYFVGQALYDGMNKKGSASIVEAALAELRARYATHKKKPRADQLELFASAESTIVPKAEASCERLLDEFIAAMATHEGPVDGLIMVPRKAGVVDNIRIHLGQKGIPYLDLVEPENRSQTPGRSALRLSTVHSARGLEADYALVFEFDQVSAPRDGWRAEQLAYISLSRASIRTWVATSNRNHEMFRTLVTLTNEYQQLELNR